LHKDASEGTIKDKVQKLNDQIEERARIIKMQDQTYNQILNSNDEGA
jgi:hypothetical protein